jgi:hypothetical protein
MNVQEYLGPGRPRWRLLLHLVTRRVLGRTELCRDAALWRLVVEVGMQVLALLVTQFVLLDRQRVCLGPAVSAHGRDLPADGATGRASGDLEPTVSQLCGDVEVWAAAPTAVS